MAFMITSLYLPKKGYTEEKGLIILSVNFTQKNFMNPRRVDISWNGKRAKWVLQIYRG